MEVKTSDLLKLIYKLPDPETYAPSEYKVIVSDALDMMHVPTNFRDKPQPERTVKMKELLFKKHRGWDKYFWSLEC